MKETLIQELNLLIVCSWEIDKTPTKETNTSSEANKKYVFISSYQPCYISVGLSLPTGEYHG